MARASLESTSTTAADPIPPSRRTLVAAFAGALLCYLAQPPLAWGVLAWIGPTPWLLLCRAQRLPGRRPYLVLWLVGSLYWFVTVYWMLLTYWANFLGFIPMSLYLGAYLPAFVALVRVAVHRFRVPLWLAGAVVWTGFEWLRGHLLTGFLMASLAHTQIKFLEVIQIAEVGGEYAVTFLILLVAGSIAAALPLAWVSAPGSARGFPASPTSVSITPSASPEKPRPRALVVARALTPAILALAATLAHGISATTYIPVKTNREHRARPRIAIIQTDMQCGFKGDPERDLAAMGDQIDLSIRTAQNAKPPVDLIVWPETMFRQPLLVRDEQNPPAAGSVHDSRYTAAFSDLKSLAVETGAALLVGIDRVIVSQAPPPAKPGEVDFRGYNAAIAVDRQGELVGLYAKMHLLPFGEYIPLAWLPGLASLVPITGTSVWGERPAAFEIDGVVYAPNICYESVLPHLIRRQVRELAAAGQRPDVLVNLTNDSWFLGSSELDMHLASGVFRAIEMRTPLVIAANRGLSAYITSTGKIAAVTERDRADALVVDVPVGPEFLRDTLYIRHGDWLPLACLAATTLLALAALGSRQPR